MAGPGGTSWWLGSCFHRGAAVVEVGPCSRSGRPSQNEVVIVTETPSSAAGASPEPEQPAGDATLGEGVDERDPGDEDGSPVRQELSDAERRARFES